MGWEAVWQLALKQFGAEAVEIRLLILLAAALGATLILIGLKHAFRPAGPRFASPPRELPRRMLAQPRDAAPVPVVVAAPNAAPNAVPKTGAQPFRARKPMIHSTRKCVKQTISSHQAPRPAIRRSGGERRTPSFTIEHAPYSPLPPRR